MTRARNILPSHPAGPALARVVTAVVIAAFLIAPMLAGPLAAGTSHSSRIELCGLVPDHEEGHTSHRDGSGNTTEDCTRCSDCTAARTNSPPLPGHDVAILALNRVYRPAAPTHLQPVRIWGPAQFWSSERAPPLWAAEDPACADIQDSALATANTPHTRETRSWV